MEKAYFAAGCFWGPEEKFSKLEGVLATRVGYSGGDVENPSYELVCGGGTGHAETTEVTFDPTRISYRELVEFFFSIHDPTQLNRQGLDVGTQYRSVIFTASDDQENTAREVFEEVDKVGQYADSMATDIVPFEDFYPAEEYHQKYLKKRLGRET